MGNVLTIADLIVHTKYSDSISLYKGIDASEQVIYIFLHFRKAFGCRDHKIKIGLGCLALQWFRSYSSRCFQYVLVTSFTPALLPTTKRFSQGSILRLLLFLIFIKNFPISYSLFKFNLFTDDSFLSCKINNSKTTETAIELTNEMKRVKLLLPPKKLLLNHSKINFIIFFYRKNLQLPPIKVVNAVISETNSTKNLGIILDKHLKLYGQCLNIFSEQLKNIHQFLMIPRLAYDVQSFFDNPHYFLNRI